ncbi:hypothetical protein SELMODRAFT_4757, partial [Selaginella moellendorffii]
IASLTNRSYKWSFKARVTHKDTLRQFTTKRTGWVFNFYVADSASSEIRIVSYGETARALSEKVIQGAIYIFSGTCGLRSASELYTPFPATWEILADKKMEIMPTADDECIPRIVLHRKCIAEILDITINSYIDLVGVVIWVGLTTVTPRGVESSNKRRMMTICDNSFHSVDVCLWGDYADEEGSQLLENISIVCIKGGRICEFNERSVSVTNVSTLAIDADLDLVQEMRSWY